MMTIECRKMKRITKKKDEDMGQDFYSYMGNH